MEATKIYSKIDDVIKKYEAYVIGNEEDDIHELAADLYDVLYDTRAQMMQELISTSFITDADKMGDFFTLTKDDFLMGYGYVHEGEYNATREYVDWIVVNNSRQKGE